MLSGLPNFVRKMWPTIILVLLAFFAGATDKLGSAVQDIVSKLFIDYAHKLAPFAVNLLIAAIVLNVAYLLYHPLRDGLKKTLESRGASSRGQNLVVKSMQVSYWFSAVFGALSFVAPDLLSKIFLGFSLLGAALTLALQGAANNFISGVLLIISKELQEGDEIELVGTPIKGKVLDVGYLRTKIRTATGITRIPNKDLLEKPFTVLDPVEVKSPIIIPAGVELAEDDEQENGENKDDELKNDSRKAE